MLSYNNVVLKKSDNNLFISHKRQVYINTIISWIINDCYFNILTIDFHIELLLERASYNAKDS